ncbi:MAG: hypothetical protein OXI75_12495 [Rhodospirillales bacterium]|nr:hypothetical protein [Rhodospirillales bacterium]
MATVRLDQRRVDKLKPRTSAYDTASSTAAVCDSIALYGASPERGELDSREVWDEDDATCALSEAAVRPRRG